MSDTRIFEAVCTNNVPQLKLLASQGVDVIHAINSTTLEESVLHAAVASNSYDALFYLLSEGAPPDIKDYYGTTPLMCSAQMNELESLKLLLNYGAKVHYRNHLKQNAVLLLASESIKLQSAEQLNRAIEILQLLESHHIDLFATDVHGSNAVHYIASMIGSIPLLDWFLNKGLHISCRNHYGSTPLLLAAGHTEEALLVSQSKKELQNHAEKVGEPFDPDLEFRGYEQESFTILEERIEDQITMIDHLIQKGAKVDESDDQGNTVLFYASSVGYLEICKHLLNLGAEFDQYNHAKQTILENIMQHHDRRLFIWVIDNVIDVNTYDIFGRTPLILAVETLNVNFAEILISRGADKNLRNKAGLTAFDILRYNYSAVFNCERGPSAYSLLSDLLN